MYSSIYRVQSSTRRLPIQALFGFTLKLVESYPSPFPSEASVWWFVLGANLGSPQTLAYINVVDEHELAVQTHPEHKAAYQCILNQRRALPPDMNLWPLSLDNSCGKIQCKMEVIIKHPALSVDEYVSCCGSCKPLISWILAISWVALLQIPYYCCSTISFVTWCLMWLMRLIRRYTHLCQIFKSSFQNLIIDIVLGVNKGVQCEWMQVILLSQSCYRSWRDHKRNFTAIILPQIL